MVMAVVLIFIIIRRASSTAIAGPLVSASPVAVSNRPPAKHNGFAPAHLRFHGYRGHYNNGYYSYECFAHNSRCLHSRINVYSAIQSRRSIEIAWRQLFGKYKMQTYEIFRKIVIKIRYDTRCYFNVRSKADISQLNLPHNSAKWFWLQYELDNVFGGISSMKIHFAYLAWFLRQFSSV